MKNKYVFLGAIATIIVLSSNAQAANNNNGSGAGNSNSQVQQQTQVANQAVSNQIRTSNSIQIQNGSSGPSSSAAIQIQQQAQQRLQDGTELGNQVMNQNQVANQGQTNQVQTNEQERLNDENFAMGEQRRSVVANAVQEMLQLADRTGGIGQQIRLIAQTQTQNQEKLEAGLLKVQNRNGFAKFLIGPNYGEINKAQKILEQNREQIQQLNQIKNQLTNKGYSKTLTEQTQTLEQTNLQVEESLGKAQKGFSLFGWMFRLFSAK